MVGSVKQQKTRSQKCREKLKGSHVNQVTEERIPEELGRRRTGNAREHREDAEGEPHVRAPL